MWLLIAAQAVLLAALGVLLDLDLWPSNQPAVLMPVLTVGYAWPVLALFTAERGNAGRAFAFASGFAAVLAALAGYVGWQATPVGAFDVEALQAVYVITLLATGFIALAYGKLIVAREPVRYEALFAAAWRNLLVVGLAAGLLGGSAILLALWAALFERLGVVVLAETFQKPWFVLPAAAVAFGTGVLVFRPRQGLIDSIVTLLENLARYLLPMVLAIIVVFLLTLPFVSLQTLWDTGNGSLILIALNAIAIVLTIVAYRPEGQAPFPRFVHLPVTVAVALLPVVSALALLGIGMRVGQYGWTVARAWAFTGAGVLALFSVGYAWSVAWQRAYWPNGMAPVNTAMGWVMLGILLLVNTPVLDFRAMSARSQLARVDAGDIEPIEFDFRYAREMLARPGHLVAQPLIEQLGFDPLAGATFQGGIVYRPEADADRERELALLRDAFWANVQYRGGPFALPDGVRTAIDREIAWTKDLTNPTLARVELGGESAQVEYLLMGVRRLEMQVSQDEPAIVHFSPAARAIVDDGSGFSVHWLSSTGSIGRSVDTAESVVEWLREAPIERRAQRFDDFRIGEMLYGFLPGTGGSDAGGWRDAEVVEAVAAPPADDP